MLCLFGAFLELIDTHFSKASWACLGNIMRNPVVTLTIAFMLIKLIRFCSVFFFEKYLRSNCIFNSD